MPQRYGSRVGQENDDRAEASAGRRIRAGRNQPPDFFRARALRERLGQDDAEPTQRILQQEAGVDSLTEEGAEDPVVLMNGGRADALSEVRQV